MTRRAVFGASASAIAGGGALLLLGDRDVAVAQGNRAAVGDRAVVQEVRRQLREGISKMRQGRAEGARQVAGMLRVYASTVNDGEVRALLRKTNRAQLLSREMNHAELVRQAQELGFDPVQLPPHKFISYADREEALRELLRDGLGASLVAAAGHVDNLAEKLEDLARRPGGPQRLQIALRQPIPEPADCGNCDAIQSGLDYTEKQLSVACALAAIFPSPPTIAACEAAAAAFLTMLAAFAACRAIVALCEAYYN